MNNKKETSFIEIVKSKMKNGKVKKDQLVILLLFGVLLLVIAMPVEEDTKGEGFFLEDKEKDPNEEYDLRKDEDSSTESSYEKELAMNLENFLSQVEGVGEVQVLIKVRGSSERVVEKDEPISESMQNEKNDTGGTSSGKETVHEEVTVYEETEDGRQIPYVVKEYDPEIEGVIIAARGGDQPVVVQNILEAVQALLQIEVHKIKVLKMK